MPAQRWQWAPYKGKLGWYPMVLLDPRPGLRWTNERFGIDGAINQGRERVLPFSEYSLAQSSSSSYLHYIVSYTGPRLPRSTYASPTVFIKLGECSL